MRGGQQEPTLGPAGRVRKREEEAAPTNVMVEDALTYPHLIQPRVGIGSAAMEELPEEDPVAVHVDAVIVHGRLAQHVGQHLRRHPLRCPAGLACERRVCTHAEVSDLGDEIRSEEHVPAMKSERRTQAKVMKSSA